MRAITLLPLLWNLGCGQDYPDPSRAWAATPASTAQHPVTIHTPSALGRLDTTLENARGEPVGIACATCHAPGAEGAAIADGEGPPETFHGAVKVTHGGLSCASCHAEDRTKLRLADGATVDLEDAMRLCAQCHGPQHRDYTHGAHGGMTGCWDLGSCGRDRNHCLDCHASHNPKYPTFLAVFPPRDRHYGEQEHEP